MRYWMKQQKKTERLVEMTRMNYPLIRIACLLVLFATPAFAANFSYWLHTGYDIPLNEIEVKMNVSSGYTFNIYYGGTFNTSNITAVNTCAYDFHTDKSGEWVTSDASVPTYNATSHRLDFEGATKRLAPNSNGYCPGMASGGKHILEADITLSGLDGGGTDIVGVRMGGAGELTNDGVAGTVRTTASLPLEVYELGVAFYGNVPTNASRGIPFGLFIANRETTNFEVGYKYLNNLTFVNTTQTTGNSDPGYFSIVVNGGAGYTTSSVTNYRILNGCGTPTITLGAEETGTYASSEQTFTKHRTATISSSATISDCQFYLNYSYFNDSNMLFTDESLETRITLYSPANNTVSTNISWNFSYSCNGLGATYDANITINGTITNITRLATANSTTVVPLALNHGYYNWSIFCILSGGASANANYSLNISNTPPEVPVLVSPSNNSFVTATPINATWTIPNDLNNDSLSYTFCIGTSAETVQNNCTVKTANSTFVYPANQTKYYWNVSANDSQNYSNSSGINNFFFSVNTSVLISSPTNGSSYATQSLTLGYIIDNYTAMSLCWADLYINATSSIDQNLTLDCFDANKSFTTSLGSALYNIHVFAIDNQSTKGYAAVAFTVSLASTPGGTGGGGGGGGISLFNQTSPLALLGSLPPSASFSALQAWLDNFLKSKIGGISAALLSIALLLLFAGGIIFKNLQQTRQGSLLSVVALASAALIYFYYGIS